MYISFYLCAYIYGSHRGVQARAKRPFLPLPHLALSVYIYIYTVLSICIYLAPRAQRRFMRRAGAAIFHSIFLSMYI